MTEFVQILIGGLFVGATYAVVALGFSLVYQVTGVINLAQGAFCVMAALTVWTLESSFGFPAIIAAPIAIVAITTIGTIIGAISFVPGLSKLSNANMLMLTAGLLTMAEGALLLIWGSQPYALKPFSGEQPMRVGALLIPTQGLWILGTGIAIICCLWFMLTKTFLGQALRACAENPMAARLMGIDVSRMAIFAFGLATAIGSIAGVMVAPSTSLQFDSGHLFTFFGFIAVAIGGIGSFPGSIIGGVLLGLLQQLTTAYVSSLFSAAISLVFLLAMLVLRPNGIMQSGVARRQDVRDENRVVIHITRIRPKMAWIGGGLLVIAVLILPLVLQAPAILSGLVISGILFISLIGLDVVMGYGGQVNLGQAGFMAVGGYTAGYLVTQYDFIPPVAAVGIGIIFAVFASVILSMVTMRLRGLYLALATLSFGLLIDALAIGLIDYTGGPSGLVGIPSFSVGPVSFDTPTSMYYLVAVIDIILVIAVGGAMRTGFGRALQAIRTDQMASAALGVNVQGYKVLALAISAALGALSGALYAFFFHFLSPDMVGTARSLELVAMLVLGGEGTLIGALLGSIILTLLPSIFQPLAIYKTFASGLLLVLCFLLLPQGLFGLIASWLDKPGRASIRSLKPTKSLSKELAQ